MYACFVRTHNDFVLLYVMCYKHHTIALYPSYGTVPTTVHIWKVNANQLLIKMCGWKYFCIFFFDFIIFFIFWNMEIIICFSYFQFYCIRRVKYDEEWNMITLAIKANSKFSLAISWHAYFLYFLQFEKYILLHISSVYIFKKISLFWHVVYIWSMLSRLKRILNGAWSNSIEQCMELYDRVVFVFV